MKRWLSVSSDGARHCCQFLIYSTRLGCDLVRRGRNASPSCGAWGFRGCLGLMRRGGAVDVADAVDWDE